MSDGWLDSTMQAINDRIKSPLWGYIILAWVWFNWPNLAMLFMSDAPVKFRIDYILSQEYFYVHYLLAPVFFGSVLAVITPYAQWLLSLAQKWATDKHSENIYLSKEKEYLNSIRLTGLKVRVAREEEKENAKIDADIKAEVERGKREELVTEDLETARKQMLKEISNLKESVSIEKQTIENIAKEKERLQDLIVASLDVMNDFFKVDNSRSLQQLKSRVEELLTVSDIEASTIRNALRQKKELTSTQALKMLDMVESKIKKEKEKGNNIESNELINQ
ncbi:hypothetical protein DQ91_002311 [Escherichia coli]|uniref:Uncharacterized protein n=1 Tax=Escherichia coli TaxID=562 RepID=A0A7U5TG39_ECOLX|nr:MULTISPECIES: hypothetical protein [Enterobacteriaceae]EFS3973234.1 hypothetical protein [Shigella sonnei]MDU5880829.1 hypothetical protein [Serratia marcescens]DAL87572.1 MAG TPA: hypothetical protein [Caudoviricetes sp.]APK43648.1 hypothetical protein RG43_10520 [Escherichia coli]AUY00549.1 hypothetical protein C3F40_01165 [Escherichia coli]